MSELIGKHFKSIRVLFTLWRCWVHVNCTLSSWTRGRLGEVQGIWLNSWEYGWTHEKAFNIRQSSVYAVKVLVREGYISICWTHRCLCGVKGICLNSWESMLNPSGVLFTLWRCWVHVSYTLSSWTHGWLGEVQGIWLNSWECIVKPSEFRLRCEDVGTVWTTPWPLNPLVAWWMKKDYGWTYEKRI